MKAWKPVLLITACITRTLLVDVHLWRTFWTCWSVTLNCSFAQLHENSMQRPSAFSTAVLQSALLHSYNPPSPKLSIDIRNAFSSVLSAANCSDKRMHTAQERIADCTWLSCMQLIRKVEVRQNTYRKQIWIFYPGAGKGHTHTNQKEECGIETAVYQSKGNLDVMKRLSRIHVFSINWVEMYAPFVY